MDATTTTYALLGLLALRSWTSYELTKQARRSLHYLWPSSEANLYREQKRLVQMGWATSEPEVAAGRTRTRYHITESGRTALAGWLETAPASPRVEIEGALRLFFGDHGEPEALHRTMRATADQTREARLTFLENLEDYITGPGPFPERAYPIALVSELLLDLLERVEVFADETGDAVRNARTLRSRARQAEGRSRIDALVRGHRARMGGGDAGVRRSGGT
jgi:DNA-binding PadR family transcriptional regulator